MPLYVQPLNRAPSHSQPIGSVIGDGERAARAKGQPREPLAHAAVCGRVGVQGVGERQLDGVRLAVELAAVEVVQVRVVRGPLRDDAGEFVPDGTQGELSGSGLGRVPAALKLSLPSLRARWSGALGPGVVSWMGHRMGETTSSGVVGWPSRTVSRKPWTAGVKARRRITSVLTRLMPALTLIRSAGASRRVRAVNGSSRALPAKPRLTSSTPPSAAASAGQVAVGPAASEP